MKLLLMQFGSILLVYTSIINLNSYKFKLSEIITMFFLTQIISTALLNVSEFMVVIPMIIIPAIFMCISTKNIVRSISIPITSVIIAALFSNLMGAFCDLVFGIDAGYLRSHGEVYWISLFITWIFIFLISKFLGRLINKKTKISNLELKGKFGLLIIVSVLLTLIIFYSIIFLNLNLDNENKRSILMLILFVSYFILLMVTVYILITIVNKEMNYKNKQIQFDSLQKYTSNLEELYTDMRTFRHDYINILSSMIGYIENKDIVGLESHFNEKILPLGKGMESNNFKIGLLKNIKIPEIKGIFSSKLIRAQELGIDISIDILEPIVKINIDIIDLSRIIGILLDNAIEAASECDKPSIKVAFINKNNSVLIIIINNFVGDIPIYKIYNRGFSTKGENRGVGLCNLKDITGKYINISRDTIIENGEFKQFLEISN